MNKFETVIGLEVHTQLKTESKIFCACSTNFQSQPNSNICPVCCGYPGVLPVFNKKVLDLAVRVALALNCKVNKNIYFERKNYFYPDLPKGYQISQYKMPLGEEGILELASGKKIRINRVHMEEDAGKLIHQDNGSLVDFNRTGIPLLEIVSEPDIRNPEEAFEYLTELKLILQYINASDCDMEKGSLRCDANISLREVGMTTFGTKVELKNMNSFKGVRMALAYEEKRQEKAILGGEKITQETRLWNPDKQKSYVMRSKEQAHDYRYFPEPDLLDFSIDKELIDQEKENVGELPIDKRRRFKEQYKDIGPKELEVFISNKLLSDFFEDTLKVYSEPKKVSNWLLGPFLEQVNALEGSFDAVKISKKNFSKIIQYFSQGKINNLGAKKALSEAITTDEDVDVIIEREKLIQVSGQDQLNEFIEEVVKENPKPVKEFLDGKDQAVMFLVGQVMKKTKGKANPKIAREMLERRIKG